MKNTQQKTLTQNVVKREKALRKYLNGINKINSESVNGLYERYSHSHSSETKANAEQNGEKLESKNEPKNCNESWSI